jgi:hypothetical protein
LGKKASDWIGPLKNLEKKQMLIELRIMGFKDERPERLLQEGIVWWTEQAVDALLLQEGGYMHGFVKWGKAKEKWAWWERKGRSKKSKFKERNMDENKSVDLEHLPLRNKFEDVRVIKLKDKVIMNNKIFHSKMEQLNLSETFNSFNNPATLFASSKKLKIRGATLAKDIEIKRKITDFHSKKNEDKGNITPLIKKLEDRSFSFYNQHSRNITSRKHQSVVNQKSLNHDIREHSGERYFSIVIE